MLQEKYNDEIVPNWIKEKKASNPMKVPAIQKVVLNVGFGNAKDHKKELEHVLSELSAIAGQQAVARYARKSIAGFDLREGTPVGAKVTLRSKRMYHFLEKLFTFVVPRVRDFRGLPENGFDQQGNYSFGFEDQTVFLEIDPNKVSRRRGVQITIVTTAEDIETARDFLVQMGLPLKGKEKENTDEE